MARGVLLPALAVALAAGGAVTPAAAFFVPEGAVRTGATGAELDRYALPVGPYGPDGADAEVLVGEVERRAWRIDAPAPQTEAVALAARAELEAGGFEILFDCRTRACGGFDFRHAVELMPAPEMLMDTADFAQISARRATGAGDEAPVYVSVLASRLLDRMHVQTVTVRPRPGAVTAAIPPDPRPPVGLPEPDRQPGRGQPGPATDGPAAATGEDPIRTAEAEDLRAVLLRDGHLRLAGLVFETGGARLDPGSEPALDALAGMLAADPDLSVVVVGHSDNTGGLEPNVALSRRRAQAVRDALVERGIARGRLGAEGIGYLAPVASNATAEGRALNRRVELVLR